MDKNNDNRPKQKELWTKRGKLGDNGEGNSQYKGAKPLNEATTTPPAIDVAHPMNVAAALKQDNTPPAGDNIPPQNSPAPDDKKPTTSQAKSSRPSYEEWYKTVPADRNNTENYDLRKAYVLAPFDELEAWRTATPEELERSDEKHLRSVYMNPDTGVYEFVKRKDHPTLKQELDWYNSDDPEAVDFRGEYKLDDSGDYYRYVPRTSEPSQDKGGETEGKDEAGHTFSEEEIEEEENRPQEWPALAHPPTPGGKPADIKGSKKYDELDPKKYWEDVSKEAARQKKVQEERQAKGQPTAAGAATGKSEDKKQFDADVARAKADIIKKEADIIKKETEEGHAMRVYDDAHKRLELSRPDFEKEVEAAKKAYKDFKPQKPESADVGEMVKAGEAATQDVKDGIDEADLKKRYREQKKRLLDYLENYNPETKEAREKREKREARQRTFAAIGDLFSSIGNMVGSYHGAKSAYDPSKGMVAGYDARRDKLLAERKAREKEYWNAYNMLDAMRQRENAERYRQQKLAQDAEIARLERERKDRETDARIEWLKTQGVNLTKRSGAYVTNLENQQYNRNMRTSSQNKKDEALTGYYNRKNPGTGRTGSGKTPRSGGNSGGGNSGERKSKTRI